MTDDERPLILIVDDTAANVKLLAGLMEAEYRIAIAMAGKQALDMVGDTRPDLILLDVTMPDLNGFEVCRELKRDPLSAGIPVIFLTARSEAEDIVEGFRAGGIDYLTKPFVKQELLARVSVHLRLQRLVAELEEKNRLLQRLSETDTLTGIANRRFILARFEETVKLATRHLFPVTAIMLDIDHFKNVNDTMGHQTGDEVLVKVAGAIRASIRDTDWLGRFGGEEFLVCLPHTDTESGVTVAEKIRRAVMDLSWGDKDLLVTVSGGVASMREGDSVDSLIARADAFLYLAKHSGRNRVSDGDRDEA
jgi:diguanylate cyclase (GGDEF)-like protein